MITSIKKKFFKAKYPFFVQKTSLNSLNDTGKGRILLCLSEQKSVLIQNGEGDEYLGKFVGDKIDIDYSCYQVIDKLILETEYVNQ